MGALWERTFSGSPQQSPRKKHFPDACCQKATMSIPKPMMRGLLQAQTRTRFIAAAAGAVMLAGSVQVFIREKNKKAADEYFKKTDMQELFRKQKKNGVFRYEEFWDDED